MACEGLTKCREQFEALLVQRRKVAANAAKHGHSLFGAEAARDLLLHFDHAQIALGLVVIKRDGKIEQEPEDHPLPPRESIQQIACRALLGSPWFSLPLFRLLRRWGRGVALVAFGEEFIIATKEACE